MIAVAVYGPDRARTERLTAWLAQRNGFAAVGTANTPAALAQLLEHHAIACVLVEPDSLHALADLLAASNPARLIVFIEDGAAAGALDKLLDANQAASSAREPSTLEPQALTPRELEVLAAMADGASNKVIARRLGISFHTVKFHVASILEKLDAESRTEAVAAAARGGLVML